MQTYPTVKKGAGAVPSPGTLVLVTDNDDLVWAVICKPLHGDMPPAYVRLSGGSGKKGFSGSFHADSWIEFPDAVIVFDPTDLSVTSPQPLATGDWLLVNGQPAVYSTLSPNQAIATELASGTHDQHHHRALRLAKVRICTPSADGRMEELLTL